MFLDKLFGNAQSQPVMLFIASGAVCLVKTVKNMFFCVIINPAALVRHGQTQAFFGSGQQVAHLLHAGRQPDGTVFWGISQGIVQKDGQDLLQGVHLDKDTTSIPR